MTPLDPVTEDRIETGFSYVIITLVGLAFMVAGGVGGWLEYHPPPSHTIHLAGCLGLFVLGGLILLIGLARKQGATVLQTIVSIAGPFIPGHHGDKE